MFNDAQKKLLNNAPKQFPLLVAAAASYKSCHKCGHGNVSVPVLLRTAVTRYLKEPAFIQYCKTQFKLPCVIGGLLVK